VIEVNQLVGVLIRFCIFVFHMCFNYISILVLFYVKVKVFL
jgi:hypothetical protein